MARKKLSEMTIASIYPLYVTKVERKGRTAGEVDQVICWLTGYSNEGLQATIDAGLTLEEFFRGAPEINPHSGLITGLICGYRVEDIEDPLTQQIRYMDKLVDEIARGKKMETILRHP